MKMRLRTDVWPKTLADAAVTGFLMLVMPAVYWFEMFVVLPSFYTLWSGWYTFHFVAGSIIFVNIITNCVGIVLCDTSIKGVMLPATMGPNWRFCSVCETIAPPRSWHCNVCKTCILKRDHHCMFMSCCIGHHNLRYFLVFCFYMFIATVYATYYNIYFIWNIVELRTWTSVFKLIFPLAMIFVDMTVGQLFLFLVLITIIGTIFTGIMLYYHGTNMLKGRVTHERNKKIFTYDLGTLKNVQDCLGERWYLVWISPFLESKLLSDGIHWNVKATNKAK